MSMNYCKDCDLWDSSWIWVTDPDSHGACTIDIEECGYKNGVKQEVTIGKGPKSGCFSNFLPKNRIGAGIWKQRV